MNIPNGSNTQTNLTRVLAKITEIAEKSADDDYIYRGEQERHEQVSSSLYREYPHTEGIHSDIASVQKKILEEAKTYIGKTDDIDETDDIEILTELQHFGGKTNLIDFTEDYLIALFFACDGSHEKDGRVILLKRESDDYAIRKPQRTINRVESQKSVFVESPIGFVEPDIVVPIPIDLKIPMLDYLQKYHRIFIATIYNDLHGFIRRSAYIEFLRGLNSQDKADEAKTRDEKYEHYEKAVRHYTEALKLKPDFTDAYNNRGNIYNKKGDFDTAIQDYDRAISLNTKYADAYNNRGAAYYHKGDFDTAIQDYDRAISLNTKYADAYSNRGAVYYHKGDFDTAIQDYNTAIELNPEHVEIYNNRGLAYSAKGDFDTAIQDFSKAIALNSEYPEVYCNRGVARLHLREWKKAKADLSTAKDMGNDVVTAFHNAYGSVEDFEGKYDVQVPEDIAALLRRD